MRILGLFFLLLSSQALSDESNSIYRVPVQGPYGIAIMRDFGGIAAVRYPTDLSSQIEPAKLGFVPYHEFVELKHRGYSDTLYPGADQIAGRVFFAAKSIEASSKISKQILFLLAGLYPFVIESFDETVVSVFAAQDQKSRDWKILLEGKTSLLFLCIEPNGKSHAKIWQDRTDQDRGALTHAYLAVKALLARSDYTAAAIVNNLSNPTGPGGTWQEAVLAPPNFHPGFEGARGPHYLNTWSFTNSEAGLVPVNLGGLIPTLPLGSPTRAPKPEDFPEDQVQIFELEPPLGDSGPLLVVNEMTGEVSIRQRALADPVKIPGGFVEEFPEQFPVKRLLVPASAELLSEPPEVNIRRGPTGSWTQIIVTSGEVVRSFYPHPLCTIF